MARTTRTTLKTYFNTGDTPTEAQFIDLIDSPLFVGDAISADVLTDGTTNKAFLATERTKLAAIEAAADVTDATNVLAAGAVMTTGTQTVAGVKTFSSSPIVPAPTTDLQAATKKYVDDAVTAGGGYTNEMAQDAVGAILTDGAIVEFTYDDATPAITATIKAESITSNELDATINASLELADSAVQAADITGKADKLLTFDVETASYTLIIGNAGQVVEMNVASANTLTVPPNASVAFSTGTEILITQLGAGQTTITAGAGVTLRSSGSKLKLAAQYAACTLIKRGTNEWYVIGELSA